MAWALTNSLALAKGQNGSVLLPDFFSASAIAVLVRANNRKNWVKAGEIRQVFSAGVVGEPLFVPFNLQQAIFLRTELGGFYLRFDPVDYHEGLNFFLWRWVDFVLQGGVWNDSGAWDDLQFWRDSA